MKKISGIYKIINITNGLIYVGSSNNMALRRNQHFNRLRANRHGNKYLQNAFNKYGESSFVFEVIEKVPVNLLPNREEFWILTLNAIERKVGYNIDTGPWLEGHVLTKEHKDSISKGKRGIKWTEQHRANVIKGKTGVKIAPRKESSKIISSAALKKWHEEHGHTEDVKKKISASVRKLMHAQSPNKWGVTGITYVSKIRKNPWIVRLKVEGRMKWLGAYPSFEQAKIAAQNAAQSLLEAA